jgi:hypothetical protein
MARRLAAARQELYEGTKRCLRERLRVTSAEFASIAALVGVDVSVIRVLREEVLVRTDTDAPPAARARGASTVASSPRG